MDNIKRISILLSLLLFFANVNAKNNQVLLKKFFTKDENNDISILVERFDDFLLGKYESPDLPGAYEKFFEAMAKSETLDEVRKVAKIPDEQKKQMVEGLQKSTLSKIWEHHRFRNTSIETDFHFNYEGKYKEFLKEVGKRNPLIEEYYESIEIAGNISPSSFSLFIHRQKELDVTDKEIRFILAVHYISMRYYQIPKN